MVVTINKRYLINPDWIFPQTSAQVYLSLFLFNVGCAILDNDCKYEGLFSNGLMHGSGKFSWADGVEYEGTFVNGKVKY